MIHDMMPDRYNAKDVGRALSVLGFNVRNPEGSRVMYCIHGRTKAQIWIPKVDDGVREDALKNLLEPLGLSIEFFRPVYMSLGDDNLHPPDQY